MAKRVKYHVVPGDDGWKVNKQGGQRASATAGTKAEAVQKAKDLAKAQPLGQVIIHKEDGTIQTEHTYGKDPERSPG